MSVSAANRKVRKVNQQQCWIRLPKSMLERLFFNLCTPVFFLSREQAKEKASPTSLYFPICPLFEGFLFVKHFEITQSFCCKQRDFQLQILTRSQARLARLDCFLSLLSPASEVCGRDPWHHEQTHLSLLMCLAFKRSQVSIWKGKPHDQQLTC